MLFFCVWSSYPSKWRSTAKVFLANPIHPPLPLNSPPLATTLTFHLLLTVSPGIITRVTISTALAGGRCPIYKSFSKPYNHQEGIDRRRRRFFFCGHCLIHLSYMTTFTRFTWFTRCSLFTKFKQWNWSTCSSIGYLWCTLCLWWTWCNDATVSPHDASIPHIFYFFYTGRIF